MGVKNQQNGSITLQQNRKRIMASMRKADTLLPVRLAGNLLFLAAHGLNIIIMHLALQSDIMLDKDLATFKTLQFKYITIWNLAFQYAYLIMSVACDVSTLFRVYEKNRLITLSKRYRTMIFSGVIWPCSLLIFTIFWPIFIYDRELVFPSFIDKVLSHASNQMMHSFIVVVVAWELMVHPRSEPQTHKWNLLIQTFIYVSYYVMMIANYYITGIWPYPLLYSIYGTIYFAVLMAFTLIVYIVAYFLQWPLVRIIHGTPRKAIID